MICAWLLTGVGLFAAPAQETPAALTVGHWLQVRGRFDKEGRLVASKAEVLKPERYETIIGTLDAGERSKDAFTLLDQSVDVGSSLKITGFSRGRWGGKRVKLEGRWRNQRRFSARKLELRGGTGRERIEGRIDTLEKVTGGYLARIMIFQVFLPEDLEIEHEGVLAKIPLSPERGQFLEGAEIGNERNDDLDDAFGGGIRLGDDLELFGQLVGGVAHEDNYNIDDTDPEDETKFATRVRLRAHWFVHPDVVVVSEGSIQYDYKIDEDGGDTKRGETYSTRIGETFAYWSDAFGVDGLDLQVGRQDFDDQREWLYDENLDGLRLFWSQPTYAVETAIATQIGGNSNPRNRGSLNASLYVSNNDRRKHLAGYLFYRDIGSYARGATDSFAAEESLHIGARALGKWLSDTKSWAEIAYLTGERGDRNVSAFGYDIGTTWSPPFASPFYLTLGYALGTGETQSTGSDGTFRQTGFQDNSARFGGVSSFRYYGELVRPELTNMGIFTAGLGARITKDVSLDFIFHNYRLDVAAGDSDIGEAFFDDFTDLKPGTVSSDPDVGWEADLVLGIRTFKRWDIKLIGAYFDPGGAFPGGDDALFARLQIRYRF